MMQNGFGKRVSYKGKGTYILSKSYEMMEFWREIQRTVSEMQKWKF